MLTVTGLWFDHERTPVGLDHTPVFGWQLEGNCRNIRQTQYRLRTAQRHAAGGGVYLFRTAGEPVEP